MTFTISFKNTIFSTNNLGSTRTEFNLPLTEVKSSNSTSPCYPSSISTLITENDAKSFDLTYLGARLKALAIKATRPVAIFIITPTKEYEMPLTTFISFLVDSKEQVLVDATEIRVEVPSAAITSINPVPPNYPNALVELFLLMD